MTSLTRQGKMCYVRIGGWCYLKKKIATKVDFCSFGFYTLGKIERFVGARYFAF